MEPSRRNSAIGYRPIRASSIPSLSPRGTASKVPPSEARCTIKATDYLTEEDLANALTNALAAGISVTAYINNLAQQRAQEKHSTKGEYDHDHK